MILHNQTHPVKSGKSWLYATSVLLILGGGIALANPSVAHAATNTSAFVRKEAPKKVENEAVARQRVATFSTAVNSVGDNIATGSITGTLEYGDWSGSDLTTDLENGDAYLSINDELGNELQDIELMGTVSGTTFSGTYSESATSASDYNYGTVTGKQSADGFWTFNFIQSSAVKAVATGSITESLSDPSYTFNGQVSDGKNFDSVWFIDADGYGVNLDGTVSGDTFTGTYEWNTYDENTGSNVNYIGTVTGTLSNGTWTFNFGQKKSMLPATFSGVISGSTSTGWTVDYSNNDNSFTDGTSFSTADVYEEFGDGDYWLNGTTTGTTFSGMYSTYDSDGNGIVAGDVTGTLSSGKWAFKFTKTSYSATGLITGTLSNPYFWDGNGNATSSTAASEMEFVDSSGDTIDLEGSTVNNKFTGTYTNESTGVTNNVTGTYSSGKWTFNFGNITAPTFPKIPVIHSNTSPFKDIAKSGFVADINWVYSVGVTTGTSATTYSPGSFVTRGQMAAFMYRLAGSPAFTVTTNPFKDVSQFKNEILWLKSKGITTGTSATTYSPNSSVTRGQMAAFLHRLAIAYGVAPKSTNYTNSFTDTKGNQFSSDIAWLKSTGITTGTSATTYSPNAPVTRGQMAAFLHRFDIKFAK
ncbi:MAG: S-layer homology domain-containing protein [Streptococcaceae bacterium]|nr:S-layer homology domain-containing protein [Streptococcaceae bacterium]